MKGHILRIEANFCHSIQYDGAESAGWGTRPPSLESITHVSLAQSASLRACGSTEGWAWKFRDPFGGDGKYCAVVVRQHLSAPCGVSEVISQLCFEKQERAAHSGSQVLGTFSCQHFQGH